MRNYRRACEKECSKRDPQNQTSVLAPFSSFYLISETHMKPSIQVLTHCEERNVRYEPDRHHESLVMDSVSPNPTWYSWSWVSHLSSQDAWLRKRINFTSGCPTLVQAIEILGGGCCHRYSHLRFIISDSSTAHVSMLHVAADIQGPVVQRSPINLRFSVYSESMGDLPIIISLFRFVPVQTFKQFNTQVVKVPGDVNFMLSLCCTCVAFTLSSYWLYKYKRIAATMLRIRHRK